MKKSIIFSIIATVVASGCSMDTPSPIPEGWLNFAGGISVSNEVQTKSTVEAPSEYVISIIDSEGEIIKSSTYGEIVSAGKKIKLAEGDYIISAVSSSEQIPYSAFEKPYYGVSEHFTISAGKQTDLGTLTCTLLQTKVTIGYSEDFLKMVTGDASVNVAVNPDAPLTYSLSYNSGTPTYEEKAGYFAISEDLSSTMVITFKGSVEGKSQKMTKTLSALKAATWHRIEFVKKIDDDGNASIDVKITDLIEDKELKNDTTAQEVVIGDDPDAPKGDGGIKLESTCSYDITKPVVVPKSGESFNLTMMATVPNKVKKFVVEIQSDNEAFITSVKAVNDGSTVLDLVNPSEGAIQIFTTLIPFPYGKDVLGKQTINFDLSQAQIPLLAFAGTHAFVMKVTDEKGCKKDIQIQLVVE